MSLTQRLLGRNDTSKETTTINPQTQRNAINGILDCTVDWEKLDNSEHEYSIITQVVTPSQLKELSQLEIYEPNGFDDRKARKYAQKHEDEVLCIIQISNEPRVTLTDITHDPETIDDETIVDFIRTFRPRRAGNDINILDTDEPKLRYHIW